jgi:hypothetical protein
MPAQRVLQREAGRRRRLFAPRLAWLFLTLHCVDKLFCFSEHRRRSECAAVDEV